MIDRVIVKALVNLVVSIDLSDEEAVDADFASTAFEDVMATLEELPDTDREVVVSIVRSLAADERSPERRQALMIFPEDFGLVDEEE
ncbi:hypothetical protein [Actinacidiphila reveromycinica]|uniref:hypothetical protein n=1 Tax=Actinacidiphila reveromycinica TaxID=659352 RepID=UPI0019213292|nr:hypothetical protein [Streptomyces sp. SN-593]